MITIAIAAYREPKIAETLRNLIGQKIRQDYEIIIATPDKQTAERAKSLHSKKVRIILEKSRAGKPAALNKILEIAKGNIIVFTDADVDVSYGALNKILGHFDDKRVGLVSAHLVPTNPINTKFGFWAHLLYDQGHNIRMNNPFFASGNLFAVKNLVEKIPENALVDDFVIAKGIQEKGYKAVYEPDAIVRVNFPTNVNDFLAQRRRTFAGYQQIKDWYGSSERSLSKEAKPRAVLSYCKKPIHYRWLAELVFYRVLAWMLAYYDIKIKKKSLIELWKPIESSK
jgi:cellulose synthase/poly-beta-1,6-N-acetylglucosamine synthase-like glycosyltransferase